MTSKEKVNELKRIYIKLEDWQNLGKKLYGDDIENWKFKCPACGRIASGKEFKEIGATPDDMYQCCISRFKNDSDCKWCAWGLFDICKIRVIAPNVDHEVPVFEFADAKEEDYKNDK